MFVRMFNVRQHYQASIAELSQLWVTTVEWTRVYGECPIFLAGQLVVKADAQWYVYGEPRAWRPLLIRHHWRVSEWLGWAERLG